jgi:hypothetical protein
MSRLSLSRVVPRIVPRIVTATALALALATPSLQPVGAQSVAAVAGKWTAEFELGMRNENGVVSSTGSGKARITLDVQGDSVIGTWVTLEPANMAAAPARPLRGVFANGVLRLQTEPTERRIMLNDNAMNLKMITRYELKLDGDTLTGTTQQVALGGEVDPPARPFKALREK